MGFLGKSAKGKAPEEPPIKKYSYKQFIEGGGSPSPAAVNTAAQYSTKAASSAALQVELESSKRRSNVSGSSSRRSNRGRLCSAGRVWMHVLTVLQLITAAGVIGVVAGCLNRSQEAPSGSTGEPASYSVCYATTRSVNICFYSYWAAAASMVLSITISTMNICCPGRRSGLCLSFEAILGLLGAAWWTAAAVTDLIFSNEANSAGLPYTTCRTVTWILCWANAGLFALSFISSWCSCCAACVGGSDDDLDP